MVTGWRRAFCTSVSSRDRDKDKAAKSTKQKQQHCPPVPPQEGHHRQSESATAAAASNKLGFFSNPTTPRLPPHPVTALRCRTTPNSPTLQCHVTATSNPSSPKSPSAFSLLKLRVLSKVRCGICLQSVKAGQGTAIFTAECSHSFHFPCIASRVVKTTAQSLLCPVCNASWKELPLLSFHHHGAAVTAASAAATTPVKCLRVYDDDEPLMSPTSAARFNPIPEEGDDETDDFQGFFAPRLARSFRSVDVRLLPETAIVAAGRGYETYAVVMKVKASAAMSSSSRRPPVDLVAVVDVGSAGRMQAAKRAMRLVVSSLGSADRLSIVAFSSMSKRLLPLRRMNGAGKRSAQKIAEALVAVSAGGQGISVGDAVKKAVKVLEDRREKNCVSTIVVLSDSDQSTAFSSTRFSVHAIGLVDSNSDALAKRISGVIRVAAQDLQLQLSLASGSAPAEITAVYSLSRRPSAVGSGTIRLGDIHSDEERELLVEIRVPTCTTGSHHVLSVRSSHRDPSSTDAVHSRDHPLLVPRLHAVRSTPATERLRNLHVATRAVVESRRLIDHGDLTGAHHLLSSSRALLSQSSSGSVEEFSRGLEAHMIELHRLRSLQQRSDEKAEPLTPTSAWRAAERLAKVAIMRKSMNRVSDLHGFENARF